MKEGGSSTYQVTVEWLRADGTRVATGPEDSANETLLIFAPSGD